MASTTAPDLASKFAELHAERERTWPREKLAGNVEQRRVLVEAFDPATVVAVGDTVTPFELVASTGEPLTSEALLADGPVALIFFRFAGCPACNIALPHYDEHLRPALERTGVRAIAVSPHLPEQGLDAIRERHGLSLTVASDPSNRLARRLGLAFLPIGNPPPPRDDPSWIGALTGIGTGELPMPAVVVIGEDGTVRFADISPDWLARTEADVVIAALAEVDAFA